MESRSKVKLIRGYRFLREARKMFVVFVLVWIGGFLAEAGFDWIRGKDPSIALTALGLTSLILPVIAVLLFLIWAVIRAVEKHQEPWKPNEPGAN
jgi:hypothetical protein